MDKTQLRQLSKRCLAGVSADERQRASEAATTQLVATVEYSRSHTLMVFLAMPSEIDTALLAQHAWSAGKRVLAPRANMHDRSMHAVLINDLTSELKPTRIGILEPIGGQIIDPRGIDLVIVPGLAFGDGGERLGRGAGFYDRFLRHRQLRAVRCGFAYELQVMPGIPMQMHDAPLDMLVTDASVRRFTRASSVDRRSL